MTPFQQAGLRNLGTASAASTASASVADAISSKFSHSHSNLPTASSSHGVSSSASLDSLNIAADAYMQIKLAQNIGGVYRSKGQSVPATKESLNDLKKKFFRQAKG